jgi:membrane protease YdiL (CAAX protease family)
MLCIVFAEEVLYHGLLMNYLDNNFGGTPKACMAAIVISSIILGLVHFWKGQHGMMNSTIGTFVFACGCYFSEKNLWPPILAHCVGNIMGYISLYDDMA